jgi:hypothetical protein
MPIRLANGTVETLSGVRFLRIGRRPQRRHLLEFRIEGELEVAYGARVGDADGWHAVRAMTEAEPTFRARPHEGAYWYTAELATSMIGAESLAAANQQVIERTHSFGHYAENEGANAGRSREVGGNV